MRVCVGVLAAFATLAFAPAVRASSEGGPIVVWPTLTPAGDEASAVPLHKPTAVETHLSARAQELDATLRDAVQDLGDSLDVADAGPAAGHMRDQDMIDRASKLAGAKTGSDGTWVVSARLEYQGSNTFLVRIVAVPP